MNYISCRQKIILCHNYDDVVPIDLEDVPCLGAKETIGLALFSYDSYMGNTLEEITSLALQLCPQFSEQEIENALNRGIQTGAFQALRPPCIDWCAPMPPTRYTFAAMMDKNSVNAGLVRYLTGLAGGTCGRLFPRFFKKYTDPVDRSFRLYKCDMPNGDGGIIQN